MINALVQPASASVMKIRRAFLPLWILTRAGAYPFSRAWIRTTCIPVGVVAATTAGPSAVNLSASAENEYGWFNEIQRGVERDQGEHDDHRAGDLHETSLQRSRELAGRVTEQEEDRRRAEDEGKHDRCPEEGAARVDR